MGLCLNLEELYEKYLRMNKDLKIKVKSKFNFYPVTKENWKDFENLFGDKGACAG